MTTRHTALVLGATGIIGRNLITHLDTRAELRSLDLQSPDSLAGAAEWLRDVTHVFFAAYQERPDAADLTRVNVALLRNTVRTTRSST